MSTVHMLHTVETIQSWMWVKYKMMCVLRFWEKGKFQEGKKTVMIFVRPHALEGDVWCVAHNPNCSGTLNAVSRYLQNEQQNDVEQSRMSIVRTGILWRTRRSCVFCGLPHSGKLAAALCCDYFTVFHGVLKSLRMKYSYSFYQSIIW